MLLTLDIYLIQATKYFAQYHYFQQFTYFFCEIFAENLVGKQPYTSIFCHANDIRRTPHSQQNFACGTGYFVPHSWQKFAIFCLRPALIFRVPSSFSLDLDEGRTIPTGYSFPYLLLVLLPVLRGRFSFKSIPESNSLRFLFLEFAFRNWFPESPLFNSSNHLGSLKKIMLDFQLTSYIISVPWINGILKDFAKNQYFKQSACLFVK